MKQFSMVEAFVFSVETIKKYPLLILAPAYLSYGLGYGILYIDKQKTMTILILSLFLLYALINAVVSVGIIRITCFAFDNHTEEIRWSIYGKPGKRPLLIFMASIFIISVLGLIGLSKASSSLSYLLGFIIWIHVLFTPYLLVEKNMTLEDSLRTSYRLTKGIKGTLVAFLFSYALIASAISVTIFILTYRYKGYSFLSSIFQPILLAIIQVAMVYVYKDIFYQDENPETPIHQGDGVVDTTPTTP